MLDDGRLIKHCIVDGQGEFPMDCPLRESLLKVHYKGMLLNKKKAVFYDTRVDNYGQPLEFKSGEGLIHQDKWNPCNCRSGYRRSRSTSQHPSSTISAAQLKMHLEDLEDFLFSDGSSLSPLHRKTRESKNKVPEVLKKILQSNSLQLASHSETSTQEAYLVGRQGLAQAACTAKELREILGMINFAGQILIVITFSIVDTLAPMQGPSLYKVVLDHHYVGIVCAGMKDVQIHINELT
ncbi:hypothetical protein Cni_G16526 [Canna indica]|uniref:Uncharacterized protein n=1 Tax=Canna indica TaxID=4628 RepID=A0AAQ3KIU8_9LILI|nr:hypothetical protein Cni_G16526 [Canna indica]